MVTNPFLRLALQVEGDRHSGLSYNNEGRLTEVYSLVWYHCKCGKIIGS